MTRMEGEAAEKMKRVGTELTAFGWKYIPGPGGTIDADYAVKFTQRMRFETVWSGTGQVAWGEPTTTESPISARIVAALRALPVVSWGRAFAAQGAGELLRAATERLP